MRPGCGPAGNGGDHRPGGRVLARDARARPCRRRGHRAAERPPPPRAGHPTSPPRPAPTGSGRSARPVAGGQATGRAGVRDHPARRVHLPGPGSPATRPLPRALPLVLPQPGLARLVCGGSDAHRGRRPGRRGRGAAAGPAAARRADHRLDARLLVRPVPDRPGVPGGPTGHRGRRLGVACRRGTVPRRPAQGRRDHPGRLGPAPVHLARPGWLARRGARRDRRDAEPG